MALSAKPADSGAPSSPPAESETSNVVTLPSARLTDRLHDLAVKSTDRPVGDKPETITSAELTIIPGQERAYRALETAAS